jgi:hypothetical protein
VAFCDNWDESFVSVKVWNFFKNVEYFRLGGNTLYFGAILLTLLVIGPPTQNNALTPHV